MSEQLTGYTFGTIDDIGTDANLIYLDEVGLLLSEHMYDFTEDTVLLAGTPDNVDDPDTGKVTRVAQWEELGLPYSYEELVKAMERVNDAVDSINKLGNSEEYRFPTYVDDMKEVRLSDKYPDGEALTGYGLAYCLGAKLPASIGERFDFYANYGLVKQEP